MPKKGEEKMNEGASGDSLSLLEQLPTELIQGPLAQYLSKKDLSNLSQASKVMFFSCQPLLAKILLFHVVKGEEAEALEMIDANPRLLLIPSKATDYSGRSYQGLTPFQAALSSHDVALWKKIESYFDKLPDGEAEKVRQFRQLFPEGLPQQKSYDFTKLVQVISNSSDADIMAALRKENNDTPICQALNGFRTAFTDLAKKEMFFNPSHLIDALKVYDAQFDRWSWNQRDLFWRQVIGYTQRFLPACYAQAFCQGLYYILEEKKPLSRSLKFQYDGSSYYPLSDSSGLGFDLGWAGGLRGAWLDARGYPRGAGAHLDKLCRANTAELLGLERRMRHDGQPITGNDSLTSRSWCTIS
ncbi:hypothetical protein [Legionella yabuuchiae]|uniref:hypothetical protein n=1 Tax=Legionella yabuuchiae TaxID=376727 RepID=UPI001056009F|nr:hypothetical protein [Legionella yabuuchiae]